MSKEQKDELVKAVQGYTTKDILEWIQTSAPYDIDTIMTMTPEEIETLYLNQNKDE